MSNILPNKLLKIATMIKCSSNIIPWDDKSLNLICSKCNLTKEFCYYVGSAKPALIFLFHNSSGFG